MRNLVDFFVVLKSWQAEWMIDDWAIGRGIFCSAPVFSTCRGFYVWKSSIKLLLDLFLKNVALQLTKYNFLQIQMFNIFRSIIALK